MNIMFQMAFNDTAQRKYRFVICKSGKCINYTFLMMSDSDMMENDRKIRYL